MTTNHHTPLAQGGELTSADMEAPLAELDAAITAITSGAVSGEVYTGTGNGTADWAAPATYHDHSGSTFGTTLSPAGGLNLSGAITPTALAANTNNWNPNGGDTAVLWRMSATGSARNLTGIVAPAVDGAFHILVVITGSQDIVLKHNSGSSTAANAIYCPGNADLTLSTGKRCIIIYDATESRWLVVGVA